MYRRPKFLEILHEIREEMSREADYDMDLFAELARSGKAARGRLGFKIESGEGDLEIRDLTADYGHATAADN
jgi:hypothetical protein